MAAHPCEGKTAVAIYVRGEENLMWLTLIRQMFREFAELMGGE